MFQKESSERLPSFPLESSEKLWEWYIPTDRLFLSRGARSVLGMEPATMSEFLSHTPEGCLQSLCELREGVIAGEKSFLETAYPVESLFVRERLFVLERDETGRAIRLFGQYEISSGTLSYIPPVSTTTKGQIGFWVCSLEERTVRFDAKCSLLLGYPDAVSHVLELGEWKQRLHPEDRGTSCRYQLVFEQPLFGDEITDELRVLREDGTYTKLLLRGSVIDRDGFGRARSLSGTLQNSDFIETRQEMQKPENGSLLSAINAAGDGLWDWNPISDEVYYSPRWLSMLGYTSEQFPGNLETWKAKIHPEDFKKIVEPQRKLADSPKYGDTFECTYRLMRADGTYAWILGRGYVTHRDAKGRATRIVGLHTNITASQADREYFENLAQNDALTGLHSRTYFDIKLANIENKEIRPLSVISCDVNGLKLVNDYMGHLAGDKLLQTVSALCKESVRTSDCVARMGGDEIVILLPSCPRDKAEEILVKLRGNFDRHNACSDQMPALVSFGLACADTPDVPASTILVEADRNMLKEKRIQRKEAHERIKRWIEQNMDVVVSLEDDRY
ncbi:sensor domain-containing diguanylate cyclase [uncultured Bilophila sp.]|uniref:GGDEF domain-containing protein n=1 Tax=uncultured Bilophila sp. TaxID=529385 RepID=UPI0026DBB2F8|nr:sensor domain-containing diguanylate cyclase [uncultured Bilophila sp.]